MRTNDEIWEEHEEALEQINKQYQEALETERLCHLRKLRELRESIKAES